MGSNVRSGLPMRNQPTATSVMVNLDALFPHEGTEETREGLRLRGWTPGALQRWVRSSNGDWIGVCHILIEMTGGGTYKAEDQLVPAAAMRPRHP